MNKETKMETDGSRCVERYTGDGFGLDVWVCGLGF